MTPRSRARRWLSTAIRIAICLLALGFVIQGVTLDDVVTLKTGALVAGTVLTETNGIEETIRVMGSDGTVHSVSRDDVARDADGALQTAYGLRSAWRTGRKDLLLAAVVLQFPVALLLGLRLRSMLGTQAIRLGYWDCVKLSFAGNFLNFATPLGSNAGDVFKAYFVSLHTDRKMEGVTTIALDRLLGLGTLILVVTIIATASSTQSRLTAFRAYSWTLTAILTAALGIYLLPWFQRRLVGRRWGGRFAFLTHIGRVDAAVRGFFRHGWVFGTCVLITIALQALAIGSYLVVAAAFGLQGVMAHALEFYAYFATGSVVQALPGPPQGLGTVELTYRYFFAPFGSASQILCVAFLIRMVVLVCALPGAWVLMTGGYRPKAVSYVG